MRPTIEPSSALGLPRMSWEASGSSSMRSSSIAMRSAGVTGAENGSSPASSASSCSSRAQKLVDGRDGQLLEAAVEAGLEPLAQPAAPASETVRTRIDSGVSPPSRTSQPKRSQSTVVLPVPAPPTTSRAHRRA